MRQRILTLLAGMALGMALVSGGYAAANTVMTATPSRQAFYIDGQEVTMTAYLIGGNNYVMLRDIGQAVGFNVYWDGAVQIENDKPYTGMAPGNSAPSLFQQTPGTITEEAVRDTLLRLKETYPSGTPYGAPYRSTSNGPYSGGMNCAGWATLCSDAAFGDLPWRRITSPRWEQIRAGDLIRYDNNAGGHVVVVVSKTVEYIKVTESGTHNNALWGGQYFKWWLEEQPGYACYTRYPE